MNITTWKDRQLHGQIWRISWPATLSNISIPLLGLVDAAILGHLDSATYLGAVAVGAAVLSFLYWGFSFLRMGTTGLIARAHGAADIARDRQVLVQSIALALIIASGVLVLHPLFIDLGMQWMAPGPELEPLAREYLSIRIYSAPAVLTTYAITGWFIGHQNTRWPMLFVILTNGLNAALDVIFIVGLGMTSDGAALATLIAEWVGCLVALGALLKVSGYRLDAEILANLRRRGDYADLLATNRHLFLRTLCLMFSFAFFTAQSAHMGENTLAVNTIMMNLLLLAAYGLDGIAHASEGLCGAAVGGRREKEFYLTSQALSAWTAAVALAITLVFATAGQMIFPLFTDLEQVLSLFPLYLPWLALIPLVSAASYLLDGIFIGTSQTRYMYYTMLLCTLGVYLPAFYLGRDWGNHGLWLAFTLFNLSRGLSLGYCYLRLSKRGSWFH